MPFATLQGFLSWSHATSMHIFFFTFCFSPDTPFAGFPPRYVSLLPRYAFYLYFSFYENIHQRCKQTCCYLLVSFSLVCCFCICPPRIWWCPVRLVLFSICLLYCVCISRMRLRWCPVCFLVYRCSLSRVCVCISGSPNSMNMWCPHMIGRDIWDWG